MERHEKDVQGIHKYTHERRNNYGRHDYDMDSTLRRLVRNSLKMMKCPHEINSKCPKCKEKCFNN